MPRMSPRRNICAGLLLGGLVAAEQGALGQVAIGSGSTLRVAVTLGNQTGDYWPAGWPAPQQASLEVNIHTSPQGHATGIAIASAAAALPGAHTFPVPVSPFGSVVVGVSELALNVGAPGSVLPVAEDGTFAGVLTAAAFGANLTYSTHGTQCGQLLAAGAPCAHDGPVGPSPVAAAVNGRITRDEIEPGWRIELALTAQAPIWPQNPSGGTLSATATIRGTVNDQPVNCPADWNGDALVTVADVFAFLSAWFAGTAQATEYGGAGGVPAIFAFLSVWFSHGVGPC